MKRAIFERNTNNATDTHLEMSTFFFAKVLCDVLYVTTPPIVCKYFVGQLDCLVPFQITELLVTWAGTTSNLKLFQFLSHSPQYRMRSETSLISKKKRQTDDTTDALPDSRDFSRAEPRLLFLTCSTAYPDTIYRYIFRNI